MKGIELHSRIESTNQFIRDATPPVDPLLSLGAQESSTRTIQSEPIKWAPQQMSADLVRIRKLPQACASFLLPQYGANNSSHSQGPVPRCLDGRFDTRPALAFLARGFVGGKGLKLGEQAKALPRFCQRRPAELCHFVILAGRTLCSLRDRRPLPLRYDEVRTF